MNRANCEQYESLNNYEDLNSSVFIEKRRDANTRRQRVSRNGKDERLFVKPKERTIRTKALASEGLTLAAIVCSFALFGGAHPFPMAKRLGGSKVPLISQAARAVRRLRARCAMRSSHNCASS